MTAAAALGRERMDATRLAERGIRSATVLQAMRAVPREAFVEPGDEARADDGAARRRALSQPYVVALMIEAAEVGPGDVVLEIGAGSGYAAAVLSRVAARVVVVERNAVLADAARRRLAALGAANVDIVSGDGMPGGGFDAILVAVGGPEVPESLKARLADGGRLVMPVGEPQRLRLVKLTRRGDVGFEREVLADVSLVPRAGARGWPDGDAPA